MDRQSWTLILSVLFAFLLAMGLASRYGAGSGGSKGGGSKSGASTAPVKKYRAPPGKMRKNARALVSSVPSVKTGKPRDSSKARRDIEVWGRLDSSEKVRSREERAAEAALGSFDPSSGIAMLTAAIDESSNPSWEVYAALGELYVRSTSENRAEMEVAFAEAMKLAGSREDRLEVVRRHAQTLRGMGELQEALKLLSDTSMGEGTVSAKSIELSVLKGGLLEQLNDRDLALAAYEDAMKSTEAFGIEHRSETSSTYRQAALRLARIYRDRNDSRGASRVRREVAMWFEKVD